ncbi:MAG: hypothetical protein ACJ79S_13085 [Gemmatimonadaceae bacterium]
MIAYPLQLTFKVPAIAPQISVTDAAGRLLLYVKQKAFKLKEKVTVYEDAAQTRPLYTIAADRVIDISAQYEITTASGGRLGAVKRRGMRSIWKAHYDVLRDGAAVMTIREENAWTKVLDGLLGEVPVLGMFTGYFFHPAYVVARPDGAGLLRVAKQPAFFEGRYEITKLGAASSAEEELALLSALMMVLLERTRG